MARFGQQRGYRCGSCEKLVEASLVSDRANSSWRDPLLAKGEPIGDGASASGRSDLRSGE